MSSGNAVNVAQSSRYLTALIFPGEPVSAAELLPAIDKYNAGLEKKAPVTLRLEPSVGLAFAGLTLHGRF